MQLQHETSKGTILFVLQPEEATNIAGLNNGHIYFWTTSLFAHMNDYPLCVEIPEGKYEFVEYASEIIEEQAKMMVDESDRHEDKYIDYTAESTRFAYLLNTPLDSFKSLMQANKVYKVNPKGEEPFNSDMYYPASMKIMQKIRDEWEYYQSRSGNWIILFKEK